MESMRSFAYFIREALSNSKKNFSTTLGAVVTIFLSLLVIGVFMVASLIIDQMVASIENQVSITVYLSDSALEPDVSELEDFARSLPEVDNVIYISKDEALERFKEQSTTGIAEQLDGNPLPASFEISLNDPEKVEQVVEQIKGNAVFGKVIDQPNEPDESIKYGKEIIEQLFSLANIIRIVCLALVLLLIFVALIFINNTIRLAILARRKEIAIMRLVGASNGFIRGPFLMEGALQALIGAGLAIGSISLICEYALKKAETSLPWLPFDLAALSLGMIYFVLLIAGLVIGLFGSVWAMRRYLKV
ncbi:MAG: permease-like cell division protein FtsX [Coriobacteriales bacterium]|jgi:cell division transport system permease protein|nr:permease-like cell division protein FtsX [Coriobacteriales bacterium]